MYSTLAIHILLTVTKSNVFYYNGQKKRGNLQKYVYRIFYFLDFSNLGVQK